MGKNRAGVPLPPVPRVAKTRCAHCSWALRDRPLQAWAELTKHHFTHHPGGPRPARPDQLAVLRGEWDYWQVQARATNAPADMNREANASIALWAYLEEHQLRNTPADPYYEWSVRVQAYSLRNAWERAVLTGDDEKADAGLKLFLTYLDSHAPAGREYDPRT